MLARTLRRLFSAEVRAATAPPKWSELMSGSTKGRLEVDPNRALKNKLSNVLHAYIRNEHEDFSFSQLCRALLLLATAGPHFSQSVVLTQEQLLNFLKKQLPGAPEKLAIAIKSLDAKRATLPGQILVEEEVHIQNLQEYTNPENLFLLMEALLHCKRISPTSRAFLESSIFPAANDYLEAKRDQIFENLEEAQIFACQSLIFRELAIALKIPVKQQILLETLYFGSDQNATVLALLLKDVPIDFRYFSFSQKIAQYYKLPVIAKPLRIFLGMQNILVKNTQEMAGLFAKIDMLSPQEIRNFFNTRFKSLNLKSRSHPVLLGAIKRAIDSKLGQNSLYNKKSNIFGKQQLGVEDIATLSKMLSFLLREGTHSLELKLGSQLLQFSELLSQRFLLSLEAQDSEDFQSLKATLLQFWKVLRSARLSNDKIETAVATWAQRYNHKLDESSSLLERLYGFDLLLANEILDQDRLHQALPDLQDILVYHLFSMSGVLESSSFLLNSRPGTQDQNSDFLSAKYFKSSNLIQHVKLQVLSTKQSIIRFFKLILALQELSPQEVESILKFFQLASDSQDGVQLLIEACLDGRYQFSLALQLKSLIPRLETQFLKSKEDQFFRQAKTPQSFLSSFWKKGASSSQDEDQKQEAVSLRGTTLIQKQIMHAEALLSKLLEGPPKLRRQRDQLPVSFQRFLQSDRFRQIMEKQDCQELRQLLFAESKDLQQVERNYQILLSPVATELLLL